MCHIRQKYLVFNILLVKQFVCISCENMEHIMSFKISKGVICLTALQLDIKQTARERS